MDAGDNDSMWAIFIQTVCGLELSNLDNASFRQKARWLDIPI